MNPRLSTSTSSRGPGTSCFAPQDADCVYCDVKLAQTLKGPPRRTNRKAPGTRALLRKTIPTGSFRHRSNCAQTPFYKKKLDGIKEEQHQPSRAWTQGRWSCGTRHTQSCASRSVQALSLLRRSRTPALPLTSMSCFAIKYVTRQLGVTVTKLELKQSSIKSYHRYTQCQRHILDAQVTLDAAHITRCILCKFLHIRSSVFVAASRRFMNIISLLLFTNVLKTCDNMVWSLYFNFKSSISSLL